MKTRKKRNVIKLLLLIRVRELICRRQQMTLTLVTHWYNLVSLTKFLSYAKLNLKLYFKAMFRRAGTFLNNETLKRFQFHPKFN